MKWETWLLFVLTETTLSMIPGPAVLFVLSQAMRRGAAKSLWANAGILAANGGYFILSATSLGAILVASYRLFLVIKWAGAGYLIYLGIQSFLTKSSFLTLPETCEGQSQSWRILRDGFLLQGANPKALLFFTAILPQFIDPKNGIALQVLILGLSSISVEFVVLLAYGELAERAVSIARSPRYEKVSNGIAGSLLIAAGIGLARLRRA